MTEWLLVLAGVALTVGTAVFVAAEFSFVALDRHTVQKAVDAGDTRASVVLGALRRLSTQLSAAQVGITLTTLVLGFITKPSVGQLLTGPVEALGVPEDSAEPIATGAALLIVTVFSMVAGELVPQFLGISAPLATAKVVAVPVRAFSVIAMPLIALLNGSANRVLRAVGVTPREELSGARTPQELASLVRRSAEAGTLRRRTAQHLTKLLDLGERTAADVMSPRVRATAIEIGATAADVLTNARITGHSRFPVIGEDWDDVRGVVHVKRAFAVPHEQRATTPVTALMGEPMLVPETIRLDPLLLQLRTAELQLAVVVDEYGGTSGVVTLEDVIEEVVGEVSDEHDPAPVEGRHHPDGSWTVPGLWRPDEVREHLGAPVPDGPAYETVGGYAMAALGRVPETGDTVAVPGWTIRVDRMEGHRVERLRFVPLAGRGGARGGGEDR